MKINDEILIEFYLKGFDDEINGDIELENFDDELLNRAYNLGRINAIMGDNISNIENYREEIIKDIKLKFK